MRGIVRANVGGKARELDAEAERVGARLAELTAAEAHHAQEFSGRKASRTR